MPPLSLSPPGFSPQEIAELVDLYTTNPDYCRAAGEYDPDDVRVDLIESDLRAEAGAEGCEVLLARDERGRLAGLLCLLDRHPKDGLPWIGLLMVHGDRQHQGNGRSLAGMVEERFKGEGRDGIRLAVLESNPSALAFWSSLGWREIDRRPDLEHGRPCIVMHKPLN
ncbi:GNAT family N-acetyltransferase [Streptomyces sp. NPDC002690]